MTMPNVRFIYSGDKYDSIRESTVTHVINILSSLISLPDKIEIQFEKLNESTYGEVTVTHRFKNRIFLNENLSAKECIVPAIHELIHISQMHTNRLIGRRDGSFIWDGKVYTVPKNPTYEVWANLPWERDVAEKQQKLLENVLKIGLS